MRKKIYISIAVVAAVILISGASILATASPATNTDPLITLSYLNNIFRTRLLNTEVVAERDALLKTFNDRVAVVEGLIRSYYTAPNANLFVVRELKDKETLNFPAGSEIMLRTATGTAVLSSGRITNYVNGSTQTTGNLVMDNMYLAIQGGIITSSGNSTILIRGVPGGFTASGAEIEPTEPDETDEPDEPDLQELLESMDLSDLLEFIDLQELLDLLREIGLLDEFINTVHCNDCGECDICLELAARG